MITSNVVRITPSLAEKFIKNNFSNRPLSPAWVKNLAERMTAGEWELNGEPIIFDEDGKLVDGQHRLTAIIRSGVTIHSVVTEGVLDTSFDTIDEGRRRGAADVLAIKKEKNYTTLGSLLRLISMYEDGKMASRQGLILTNKSTLKLLESHPDARGSAEFASHFKSKFPYLAPSVVAFTHWLFVKIETKDAVLFFDKLCTGVNLASGDPVLVLRDKIIYSAAIIAKMSNVEWSSLVIKGWNAFRKGKSLKRLSIKKDDNFPTPV